MPKMNRKEIIVSSPGKIILHGEHAVVYGKSAIAASLNLRTYMQLVTTDDGRVSVDLPNVHLKQSWPIIDLNAVRDMNKVDILNPVRASDELVRMIEDLVHQHCDSTGMKNMAAITFLYLYTALCQTHGELPSISIKAVSKLPVGAGLGSSASFSVCLAASLLLHQGLVTVDEAAEGNQWMDEHLQLINKWAYQGERFVHGTPSGIDNAVATYGGAIKFQGGEIRKLSSIPNLRILLTNTRVPRSTKSLVVKVRERYEKHPNVMKPIMNSIGAISEKCERMFRDMETHGDNYEDAYHVLEDLIDINHCLLQSLGVSHVTLDKICRVTFRHHLHSKLTGAGGGGCAFTLLWPSTEKTVIQGIKQELGPDKFDCWETDIGGSGVALHSGPFPEI